jgi:hypothetical protein
MVSRGRRHSSLCPMQCRLWYRSHVWIACQAYLVSAGLSMFANDSSYGLIRINVEELDGLSKF